MPTVYVRARVGVLEGAFFTAHPMCSGRLEAEKAQELFAAAARSAQAEDLGVLLTLQAACTQGSDVEVDISVRALH
jgi:hypothetical protein